MISGNLDKHDLGRLS